MHCPHHIHFASLVLWLLLLGTYFSCVLSLDCMPLAKTFVVDQSGKGDYKTVMDAIGNIPVNNNEWIKVHINAGTYLEKIIIPEDKGCIIFEGEGREKTIISWNDHMETDESATFEVRSDNFVAKLISFENSYNIQEELFENVYEISDVGANMPKQAVAATLLGDKYAFYQCGFLGYQDTLWDQSGRHYFNDCYIQGAIDFIFGKSQSFYENCVINVTSRGYITAQHRDTSDDPSGYVFESCNVTGRGPTYLGRAYGPFSRVIYHACTIDVKVTPAGWFAWNYRGKESNFDFVESDCKGAHYDTSKRHSWVKILDGSQLPDFTRDKFINQDGWIQKQPIQMESYASEVSQSQEEAYDFLLE